MAGPSLGWGYSKVYAFSQPTSNMADCICSAWNNWSEPLTEKNIKAVFWLNGEDAEINW